MIKLLPFFTDYLLFPLLAICLIIFTFWLNSKHEFMSGKRLGITLLVGGLILALPGFGGLVGLQFIPTYYLLIQAFGLVMGLLFLRWNLTEMGPFFSTRPTFVILFTLSTGSLGAVLFAFLFNSFSLIKYGLWAATSLLPFLLPVLFAYTFGALVTIPNEIYKLWYYPRHAEEISLEASDFYRLTLLEIQIYKNPGRKEPPIKVKARAAGEVAFGAWFQKFIDDYNYKFPNDPILVLDDTAHEYGWLFYYLKPSLFRLRFYINTDQTITQNKLRENYLIVAKRVEEIN